MSYVKTTEILVSTKAFIATLSYPIKGQNNEPQALIEVNPVISAEFKDIELAEDFFYIISHDASGFKSREKRATLNHFVERCTRRIAEEFWDSCELESLKKIAQTLPVAVCVLYDKSGQVLKTENALIFDVLHGLQAIEEKLFIASPEQRKLAFSEAHKEFRRDLNRQTHKYFLHHRLPH